METETNVQFEDAKVKAALLRTADEAAARMAALAKYRWSDAPGVKAHVATIARKEARVAELRSQQENATSRLVSARASAADVAAYVSIDRASKKDLEDARAAIAELEAHRDRARGEELALVEELAGDRLALETLKVEAMRSGFGLILARQEELVKELEPLLDRTQEINAELEQLHVECRRQFPVNGPGSELRALAAVPGEGGFTVSLVCAHATSGAVSAWKERWRATLAHAKGSAARLAADANAKPKGRRFFSVA